MSVLRWSLDLEKQQYRVSQQDYINLLNHYSTIYYKNPGLYKGYSRGSKNDLLCVLNKYPEYYGIWLPYSLVGHNEKARHIIEGMLRHNLNEHIIAHRLIKSGLKEENDWEWIFEQDQWVIFVKNRNDSYKKYQRWENEFEIVDYPRCGRSADPYDIDWEEQAEIECRGNIEW